MAGTERGKWMVQKIVGCFAQDGVDAVKANSCLRRAENNAFLKGFFDGSNGEQRVFVFHQPPCNDEGEAEDPHSHHCSGTGFYILGAVRLVRLSAAHPTGVALSTVYHETQNFVSIGVASVLQPASCTKLSDTESDVWSTQRSPMYKICRSDDGCAGWAAIGAAR